MLLRRWIPVLSTCTALFVSGCCKSIPGMDEEGSALGESLTGAQAVERLKAKGWEPMSEPMVLDKGNAKTTTFMSKPPTTTIMIMEWKSRLLAKASYDAMKGQSPEDVALYGSTLVQVSGSDAARKKKALEDIKP